MAQRAEITRLRIIIGYRPNARYALAQVNPQPGAILGLAGGHMQGAQLAAPPHRQNHIGRLGLQGRPDILRTANGFFSDFYQLIPDFQTGVPGRRSKRVVISHHRQGVAAQLQPDDLSYRHQKPRRLGLHRHPNKQHRR